MSTSKGLISVSASANTNPSAASSSFLYISRLKHTISASISHGWILYPCQHSVDSSRTGSWYNPSLFLKYTYGQQYLLYPVNKNVTFCLHPVITTWPFLLILPLLPSWLSPGSAASRAPSSTSTSASTSALLTSNSKYCICLFLHSLQFIKLLLPPLSASAVWFTYTLTVTSSKLSTSISK
ncbi:hypothetical protein AYI69_g1414 [Smittium culicis]|uniref:Uncharacterized protein n=1 Tax=Smittium culicis TaxID=133412 RepID=A0A1R1YQF6_9FUNG|nr:hypothetical protein AYI69_g5173 [Smittium culicis]OMJ29100.1 hypothetical protein AYI69_g1414 [Smittium culicis]